MCMEILDKQEKTRTYLLFKKNKETFIQYGKKVAWEEITINGRYQGEHYL